MMKETITHDICIQRFSKKGFSAIENLKIEYSENAGNQATENFIRDALSICNQDLFDCLDRLAKLVYKLAVSRPGISIKGYQYVGSDRLYDLLDELRGCYQQMIWAVEDDGYSIDQTSAFNNTMGLMHSS